MAHKGCVENVRKIARFEKPTQMPVFCCSEEFDVRVAGYTYEDYCQDSAVIADVHNKVIEEYGYDWAWLQIDDCIIYELLGVGVKGSGNILRATYKYLPPTRETLDGLKMPDVRKDGRCAVLVDACKRMKDRWGDDVLVCGRTEGPFSSAALVYGIEQTMMTMMTEPELLIDTMNAFVELQLEFGVAQKEAGADALWLGGCNASGHLMGIEQYKEFAAPPLKVLAKGYRDAGICVLYHASEENADFVDFMADLGFDFISIGPGGDIAECQRRVAGRCGLLGNVDPIGNLMNGTPETVAAQTREIMETVSVRGGHIINSGEMVPRDCPEENIRAFVETARQVWKEIESRYGQ